MVGQPHSAATWFPVNDHPADAASYSFEITVPAGLQAVANGVPGKTSRSGGWTTWTWNATDPMASYQVAVAIGEFDISTHNARGLKIVDAIDPDLFIRAFTITDGTKAAYSGAAARSAYKRLSHVIDVPASGGSLAFDTGRDIESSWDFFFVEAHTVGVDDWTTLPAYDDTGHEVTSDDPGLFCVWENPSRRPAPVRRPLRDVPLTTRPTISTRCATRTGRPASGMPSPARARALSGGTSI